MFYSLKIEIWADFKEDKIQFFLIEETHIKSFINAIIEKFKLDKKSYSDDIIMHVQSNNRLYIFPQEIEEQTEIVQKKFKTLEIKIQLSKNMKSSGVVYTFTKENILEKEDVEKILYSLKTKAQ